MAIDNTLKIRILDAIKTDRENFTSDGIHTKKIGINKGIYSQLKKGVIDRILSDGEWIRIGRTLNVQLSAKPAWIVVETPVFDYISSQLEYCQRQSSTGLFCDDCDIGKTETAKHYASTHRNVVLVDCSQVKSKQKFIRFIASQFGVDSTGKLVDVIADMVYYVKTLEKPLIIFDEAGDLEYNAFLEIKALYNHLERMCGFYMIGAEGLKAKFNRAIHNKKVGYAEIFSRFGSKHQAMKFKDLKEKTHFRIYQAELIIKANAPQDKYAQVLKDSDLSLRRIHDLCDELNQMPAA
ncbi:MAG TPA: ATP-binding protein [Chitinophagales bacterium]|nr:ATP-binding protein [Chitinophagales bacterium]